MESFQVGCSHTLSVEIDPKWKVLEIGGGANPCPRSNVITNYEQEKNQRGKPYKVIPSAKMFDNCNVEDIPMFKDKEFDFCLAIQILEHVDDPYKACHEIMRVSKAGYIECPAPITEKMLGWPFHKWFVTLDHEDKNKLVFIKKRDRDFSRLDDFFFDMFYKTNPSQVAFKSVYFKYYDVFLTYLYWNNWFDVEVVR